MVKHPRLTRSRTACAAAVLLMALCCAGCGRRGALEAPPDASAAPAADADGVNPQHKASRPKKGPIGIPTGPFILDPVV